MSVYRAACGTKYFKLGSQRNEVEKSTCNQEFILEYDFKEKEWDLDIFLIVLGAWCKEHVLWVKEHVLGGYSLSSPGRM